MDLRKILAISFLMVSVNTYAGRWDREYKLISYFNCGVSFNGYLVNILNHIPSNREVDYRFENQGQPGIQRLLYNYRWYSGSTEYLYQLLKTTPMDGSVPSSYEERKTKFKDYFASSISEREVPLKEREKLLNEMMTFIEQDLIRVLENVKLEELQATVTSNNVNRAHLAVYGKNALLERVSACDHIQNPDFKKAYRAAGDLLIEAFKRPGDPRPGIEDRRPQP